MTDRTVQLISRIDQVVAEFEALRRQAAYLAAPLPHVPHVPPELPLERWQVRAQTAAARAAAPPAWRRVLAWLERSR